MDRNRYIELRRSLDLSRRPHYLWRQLAEDAALLAAVLFIGGLESAWSLTAVPLLTIFMYRNFGLMHEATHGLVSRNRVLNDVVGAICGGFCLLPYEPWKAVHLEHHYWSGNVEKDPVMAIVKNFPTMSRGARILIDSFWRSWIPIIAFLQHVVFWITSLRHAIGSEKPVRQTISVLAPAIVLTAAIALTPAGFATSILAPALLLYLIATEIVNVPHHMQLQQHEGDTHLPAWKQYETARTCVYPRWLARIAIRNFNYHAEHHVFPDVPWYHLDRLHDGLKAAAGAGYNEDPQFAWILKNRVRPIGDVMTSPKSPGTGGEDAA